MVEAQIGACIRRECVCETVKNELRNLGAIAILALHATDEHRQAMLEDVAERLATMAAYGGVCDRTLDDSEKAQGQKNP